MTKLALSSVLLFCLVTPFIMTYRLGPGETPYWYFGIIFALLLDNLILDLVDWRKKIIVRLKSLILWLVIVLVIGGGMFAAIIVRHRTAPVYNVHDIILQQEAAIEFLLQGINPYATTYFNTPLADWHYSDKEVNPALFHLVMMPWYLWLALPFRLISVSLFSFWDGRMPLLFAFGLLLVLAWRLLKAKPENQRLLVVLLAFNPAALGYFLEGRSDLFMYAFLFWSWYLLEKKRYFWAGAPMALALATKQSAWPVFPFYLAFLWFKKNRGNKGNGKLVGLAGQLLPFAMTFSLVVLPFFLWGEKAFWESTVLFLSGQAPHSYPVAGYGWGMVLRQIGVIGDITAYYPFWLWQAAACLPSAGILLRWLSKKPEIKRLIICYGVFTFIFWYFSRYFNNSHLGYLSTVFITAYFWPSQRIIKETSRA